MSNSAKSDISLNCDAFRGLALASETDSLSRRQITTERPIQPIDSHRVRPLAETSSRTIDSTVKSNTVDNRVIKDLHIEYIEEIKPILKRKSLEELEIKTLPSILKKRDSFDSNCSHNKWDTSHESRPVSHPILKRHSLGSELDPRSDRNGSALVTTDISVSCGSSSSQTSHTCHTSHAPHVHPILKHRSLDEYCVQSKDEQTLPKPILKKKWSIEDQIEKSCIIVETNDSTINTVTNVTNISTANININNSNNSSNNITNNSNTNYNSNRTRSILKTGFDYEKKISIMSKTPEVRGILKTGHKNNSKPVKSALKKSDQTIDNKSEVKSILKPETIGSNEKIDICDDSSSSSNEDMDSESNSKSDSEQRNVDNDDQNESINDDQNVSINDINDSKSSVLTVLTPNSSTELKNNKCSVEKRNDEKRNLFERHLTNNKKGDNKRPTSCIILKTTQPVSIDNESTPLKSKSSGGTISERMAALKRNGEENWKRRVPKDDETAEVVELRVPSNNSNRNRCSSIADRVSLLEDASIQWKNRVEEKDVKQFTVAGKMMQTDTPVIKTPEVTKKTPKAVPFRSKTTADRLNAIQNERPVSSPNLLTPEFNSQTPNCEPNTKKGVLVSIPKADDDITFNSFFSTKQMHDNNEIISDQVFDEISADRSDLLIQKKFVRTQSRRRPVSSNPIKKLAARSDFTVGTYIESSASDTEKKDFNSKRASNLGKSSSFALSALAGLASSEDFKSVAGKLRSSTSTRDVWKSYDIPNSSQSLMLVQVKGRRRAQTRLVEPDVNSINSGDCYILITRDNIYAWIGQYSNIIERTKTLEIANQIQKKKDLCFRSSNDILIIDNQKENFEDEKNNHLFLKALKSSKKDSVNPPKNPEEDEYYEEAIIGTNMIYRVNNEELVPLDNYWGRVPRFEMLCTEDAYVFDFGSEMYVWVGKLASNIKRKCALDSAKDLWNKGYDYSGCDINPLGSNFKSKDDKRPNWTWFTKVNQNMESVLFKDKFLNWPSISRVVKSNSPEKDSKYRDICAELNLSALNAKAIIETKLSEPDMILEKAHLGRGVRWDDEQESTHITITTLNVKCWHISEYEKHELTNENMCYFYSGDTYVVRWHYRMSRVGRNLKTGNVSRHSMIGRDRCCYFFWNGSNTKNTEKGALALMTIELDNEKAEQVRVSEGREEPCFLNIFKGAFVILLGKRGFCSSDGWKMFYVRGVVPNEACLIEIQCKAQSLRSRTSFAFVNPSNNIIYVWNGSKCLKETRAVMKRAIEMLINNKSNEIGLLSDVNYSLKEFEEGNETKEFWDIIENHERKQYRQLYYSLIDSTNHYSYTPRLFHFSSSSGEFESKEIMCSYRSIHNVVPYPFLQSDLYSAQQPTFFLFDNQNEVYLWESKFPFNNEFNEESEVNITTGSVNIRWIAERKCALDTTLAYCHAKNPEEPPNGYVISAGLEPDCFCCLFPQWKYREDVARIHINDGRKPGEMLLIQEVLSQLRNTGSSFYKLEQLRKRPLPDGLNPLCLESYLEDQEFEEGLGMSREEFYALPTWKQRSLKQKAELF